MDIIQTIFKSFTNYIEKTFSIKHNLLPNFDISINTDAAKEKFGDITTNLALVLAKKIGNNPQEIANKIKSEIQNEYIQKIEIAGPGFINITLNIEAFKLLSKNLYLEKENFYKLDNSENKYNYSVEFVSANPTGPLHIGHGRGGIIGDVLAKILKFIGHNVTSEFYINDAGVQIEKLGLSFRVRCMQLLGQDLPLPEDAYHGNYLIELADKCVKEYGVDLENKSEKFFGQYAKEHLLSVIKQTLENYGITYDVWFSEKQLHDDGSVKHAIEKLENLGYIYKKDDALWFKSTDFGDDKDRVVQKSSGETTYVAADIAYLENKIDRGANKLIYVLGQDHHSYVKRLKGLMQALGNNPIDLDVILYQLVTIKESGEVLRLSKRAGRIITLEDVINTVGKDVARFFYLNKKADAHLDFDIDLALKHSDENPVYYAQYAYVRTKSILAKANSEKSLQNIGSDDSIYLGDSEKLIIKKIYSLKQLLFSMAKNYQTHLLTYFVIELAQAFHSYYNLCKVIQLDNIEQSRGRLLITKLISQTFKICFDLLGISAPEKM